MTPSHWLGEFANVKIAFGLQQQGHIPTVEKMISEGKSWDEIGNAIGWHGPTAEKFYKMYCDRKATEKQMSSDKAKQAARLPEKVYGIPSLSGEFLVWLGSDKERAEEMADASRPVIEYHRESALRSQAPVPTPDWCDACNAPQMVAGDGEHLCGETLESCYSLGFARGRNFGAAAPVPTPPSLEFDAGWNAAAATLAGRGDFAARNTLNALRPAAPPTQPPSALQPTCAVCGASLEVNVPHEHSGSTTLWKPGISPNPILTQLAIAHWMRQRGNDEPQSWDALTEESRMYHLGRVQIYMPVVSALAAPRIAGAGEIIEACADAEPRGEYPSATTSWWDGWLEAKRKYRQAVLALKGTLALPASSQPTPPGRK